jgi:hypothetical protein
MSNGGFLPVVKWLGREEGHLPSSNAELKNECSCTAIRLGLYRDSLTYRSSLINVSTKNVLLEYFQLGFGNSIIWRNSVSSSVHEISRWTNSFIYPRCADFITNKTMRCVIDCMSNRRAKTFLCFLCPRWTFRGNNVLMSCRREWNRHWEHVRKKVSTLHDTWQICRYFHPS